MPATSRTMIVMVSLLAGLSIPLTVFSTNTEEKPNQAAAATAEKPGPGQPTPGQPAKGQSNGCDFYWLSDFSCR
jgi:hypothetical protein